MARVKYTITAIRDVANDEFEVEYGTEVPCETDEQLLEALKEYLADDGAHYIIEDLMTEESDKIDIELVK